LSDPQDLLPTAIEAARAGASVIMAAYNSGRKVDYTAKAQNDFVTAVDRESEAAIVSAIHARFPDHGILAEESAASDRGGSIRWIVDPLDGTTNFIHRFPVFAVSIAAAVSRPGPPRAADIVAGVVFDPIRDELFAAERGRGATLNGERIQVSGRESLETSLLLTGFPFRAQHLLTQYLSIFSELHKATQGIRRPGSASLDLASVACGRAEGFFELLLSAWDMAAGSLLVTEAGGSCRDFDGGAEFLASGNILAGTPAITDRMLEATRKHFP
jgi:myo-inositol-1(or 4)-monophosphatase